MNMKEAVVSVLTNWDNFSGRACRSEYWYFLLASILLGILFFFLEIATGKSDEIGIVSLILQLVLAIPTISVTSRRLQDWGYSGWWQLSYLIIIGLFVIPLLCIFSAKEDENKWGRNPLLEN